MTNLRATFWDSFSPLSLRDFRIYLGGQAVSLIGTWLQMTAQSWVVWEISHSNAALGITGMLATLPILFFGPWAGVLADRLDRRFVLIATQVVAMLLAFLLALLVMTGTVLLWHVYVLSFLLGIVSTLDLPAQQAFIGDLSGMSQVRKAIVLNAMIVQVSRMLGPALAGLIIGALGAATAFWLNGVSFLAVIASLLLVRSHQIRKVASSHPLAEYAEGLRFIGGQPRIQDLMFFVVLMTFFGLPVLSILPSVVGTILHGEAEMLGYLMAASGAGALVGTLFVVPLAQSVRRIGLLIALIVGWMGVWVVALSGSTWLPLSIACMFFMSLGAPTVFTTANGLLQVLAPPNMRARLLSTFVMVSFGLQPIATLFVGFSADALGPALAIRVNGVLLILGAALIIAVRSPLRRWEANFHTAEVAVEVVEVP